MSYYTTFTDKARMAEAWIDHSWVQPIQDECSFITEEQPFYKKHLLARIGYATLIPLSLTAATVDTAIGIFAGVIACATLAQCEPICWIASDYSASSNDILVRPYRCFIKMMNVNAPYQSFNQTFIFLNPFKVGRKLHEKENNSFTKKQILSRVSILAGTVLNTLYYAFNGITRIPATLISTATLGIRMNEEGLKPLQVTGVIGFIVRSAIGFLNPSRLPLTL